MRAYLSAARSIISGLQSAGWRDLDVVDQDLYQTIDTLSQLIGIGEDDAPSPAAKNVAAARERARKAGKCIVCRKRKARAGKTTCKTCNEAAKARVKRARNGAMS